MSEQEAVKQVYADRFTLLGIRGGGKTRVVVFAAGLLVGADF